jgi:hypothetical protein
VRNTPHHVIIAVSSSGGSAFDEMLERSAGLQGIVDAAHSTHPLVSEIAGSTHIMHAQDESVWFYTLRRPPHPEPAEKALSRCTTRWMRSARTAARRTCPLRRLVLSTGQSHGGPREGDCSASAANSSAARSASSSSASRARPRQGALGDRSFVEIEVAQIWSMLAVIR